VIARVLASASDRRPEAVSTARRGSACGLAPRSYPVAREALVDQAALTALLRSGHIGSATLDVFEREPLPADHPLWGMPQVLITPHLASVAIPSSSARQMAANILRVAEGEEPMDVVDPGRGY
jgi:glyoxylate/hydroxypyruvate reductase A